MNNNVVQTSTLDLAPDPAPFIFIRSTIRGGGDQT